MCYEYRERTQRLEERRRRELLDQQRRPAERDLERTTLEQLDWQVPEEPTRTREEELPV